jgi:hypothetical protein
MGQVTVLSLAPYCNCQNTKTQIKANLQLFGLSWLLSHNRWTPYVCKIIRSAKKSLRNHAHYNCEHVQNQMSKRKIKSLPKMSCIKLRCYKHKPLNLPDSGSINYSTYSKLWNNILCNQSFPWITHVYQNKFPAHIPYFIRKPDKELDYKNLNLVLFLMMTTNELLQPGKWHFTHRQAISISANSI